MSVDMNVLRSDDYRAYFAHATPTQYGPKFAASVHSHIVFSRVVDEQYSDWLCDSGFVPLDKRSNQILSFDESGGEYDMMCFVLFHALFLCSQNEFLNAQ